MIKPQTGLKRSLKAAINHARSARHNGVVAEQIRSWQALLVAARAKLRVSAPHRKSKLSLLAAQLEEEIALASSAR